MVRLKLPKQRVTTVPASIFRRFLAFILDLLVLDLVVAGPFRSLFIGLFGNQSVTDIQNLIDASSATSFLVMMILLLLGLLFLLYFMILEFMLGQTLGKHVFKLRVQNDLKYKKSWQYIVRSLMVIPVFPFFILWIVDPIHMFFSMDGQRWTEKISKTRVVQDVVI